VKAIAKSTPATDRICRRGSYVSLRADIATNLSSEESCID
jgi:hypothetical protein